MSLNDDQRSDTKKRKGWKDHLLRSGVPLEYEVAKIFAEAKMEVTADFAYLRRDGGNTKEMSVDMLASWEGRSRRNHLSLHMLVECKYRSPEKCFLLFPGPSNLFSLATLGGTVNAFSEFTPWYLPLNTFVPLERELSWVYKGVELHEQGAFEEDLRHGIQQLRYATPTALRNAFEFSLDSALGEWPHVIFFAKVLVTNAPLRVLSPEADIASIRSTERIEDISTEVEALIFYSEYGPDYRDHFEFAFKNRRLLDDSKLLRKELKQGGKIMKLGSDDPAKLVQDLMRGYKGEVQPVSTQFFVATTEGLPWLLSEIQAACMKCHKGRTTKPPR